MHIHKMIILPLAILVFLFLTIGMAMHRAYGADQPSPDDQDRLICFKSKRMSCGRYLENVSDRKRALDEYRYCRRIKAFPLASREKYPPSGDLSKASLSLIDDGEFIVMVDSD